MLKKKDYVSVSKRVHKQKLQLAKVFVTTKSIYTALKEKKHPNVNIEYSNFCAYRPKWFDLAGSKMTQSVCV